MALYSKIDRAMYADEKYRALSSPLPNGKTLWSHLIAGPHLTPIPGLSTISEVALADALDWPLEGLRKQLPKGLPEWFGERLLDGFREAFRELSSRGMAKADWVARVVWVPNAIKRNSPENPNVIRGWKKHAELIPECDLKYEAIESLRSYVERLPKPFGIAFHESFGEPYAKPGTGAGAGTGTALSGNVAAVAAVGCAKADPKDAPEEPAASSRRREGKAKSKELRPEHKQVSGYFRDRWVVTRGRGGSTYGWKNGRDDATVKWLLDCMGRDPFKAQEIIDAFLADDDPWLLDKGHDINWLKGRFNRYQAESTKGLDWVPAKETPGKDELFKVPPGYKIEDFHIAKPTTEAAT